MKGSSKAVGIPGLIVLWSPNSNKDLTACSRTRPAPTSGWILLLVAFLIGFDVAARLLPHAPGFLPVAASALFAGRILRIPALAVVVPLARHVR